MSVDTNQKNHTAEDAALGFYYQTFYALLTLLKQTSDDAAICVEGLDDVELVADGVPLLIQLKHSISDNPTAISIKSKAVWRTLKVWIDAISVHDLSTASFHLVAVGQIDPASPLALLQFDAEEDRTPLCDALLDEAKRVISDHASATALGQKSPPFQDRIAGCNAFVNLTPVVRTNFIRRISILPGSTNIAGLEALVCAELLQLPKKHRESVAKKLIGWWDREVVYSLCGKRERFIYLQELQKNLSEYRRYRP